VFAAINTEVYMSNDNQDFSSTTVAPPEAEAGQITARGRARRDLGKMALVGAAGAALGGKAFAAESSAVPAATQKTSIYDGDHTALLIVDPYNDFMSEGGKLYNMIKQTAAESGMFDNLRKVITAGRAAGLKVFIVPHHPADPHGHDYDGWQHLNLFMQQTRGVKGFEIGTWGGEFNPEFGPKPGDVVVKEHFSQNGFAGTDLELLLRQHGIEKVILIGVIANSCIEATGRYAMELGYHVTIVTDATAAFNPEGMVAAKTNAPLYAHAILTSQELLTSLPAPAKP
jgi:nicotinamidase-related amidase